MPLGISKQRLRNSDHWVHILAVSLSLGERGKLQVTEHQWPHLTLSVKPTKKHVLHTVLYNLINAYKVVGNSYLKEPSTMLNITITAFILEATSLNLPEEKRALKGTQTNRFF